MDMPQLKGPVVQALYAHGRAWLEGATSAFANEADKSKNLLLSGLICKKSLAEPVDFMR